MAKVKVGVFKSDIGTVMYLKFRNVEAIATSSTHGESAIIESISIDETQMLTIKLRDYVEEETFNNIKTLSQSTTVNFKEKTLQKHPFSANDFRRLGDDLIEKGYVKDLNVGSLQRQFKQAKKSGIVCTIS